MHTCSPPLHPSHALLTPTHALLALTPPLPSHTLVHSSAAALAGSSSFSRASINAYQEDRAGQKKQQQQQVCGGAGMRCRCAECDQEPQG